MDSRKFTVNVIKSPEGGFTGKCLELPAAISEGDTMEELEKNMKEAISLVLETIEEKISPDEKFIVEIPDSPTLSDEEIADIDNAMKSKTRVTFNNVDDFLAGLHKDD